ncbi:MAG TPA: peptidylprolyl isomerase [Pirellulales bacterium]|jgi:parvulin-like peptidyl-prolyl isomerase|nr:peptidylprolyl isomerase [Pirellulales bacterium]
MNAAKPAGWFFSGMAVLGLCMLARWYMPAESADAKPPAPVKKASATERSKTPSNAAPSAPVAKRNPVAALVNNEPITREELGKECLLHYGAEVLESMVNRTLILSSCEERNIVITDEQIGEEIDRMARKFALPKDQWLKMLEKERGIKPDRYGKDIIWPTLALRELAKNQLKITPEEIEEAYDSEFGPAVKVRLIAIHSAEKAKQVRAQAVAKPEEFPALAKKYSQDTNSASAYGLIQPIRHRMGDANLEKAAFALKKGEVSQVVKVGEMHVFVKCEEHMPPAKGVDRAKVEPLLADALKDRKLRMAAGDVFKELQENAKVENVYNDPVKNKQMPGVAAVINGQKILIRELAEECIDRHGKDVLEGAINRRLLDQALRKRNLKISDDELDAEIGRAATAMGKTKPNGQPDIEAWLAHVAKTENITRDVYVRDEVWPSVALKKLVGDKVPITNQDLQRGYEANYGPKVRCRAIVLNNQHRAQEIWEKARHDMNVKAFGDLAEQYSIEAGSRSLRGEVPPIQRHGGQPLLETEAFALDAENPLSGIIQVGGNFIILFFEGRTTPVKTSFEEVKDLVYRDIHEKKLRLAMAKMFDNLKEDSHVDNFVTANIKLPKKEEKAELDIDPGIKTPKVHKR